MSDWTTVAGEFRNAARELRERGYYRSALGRCYCAAFALSSQALRTLGLSMPQGWDGPRHAPLISGELYSSHLSRVWSAPETGRAIYLIATLYRLRRLADYSPFVEIEKRDIDLGLASLIELEGLLARIKGASG
jgi:hypothetical protein